MDWNRAAWVALAVGIALLVPAGPARAAAFSDAFSDRQLMEGLQGVVTGSNVGATVEANEPRHGGKRGGHSVWISWVAPGSGLLRLSTGGSSFDTTLSVYRKSGDSTATATGVGNLERLGDNDDDEDEAGHFPTSATLFKVVAGVRYEIAIDGYAGAVGEIRLTWAFTPRDRKIPVVSAIPGDRSVREGETLTLSAGVDFGDETEYRWYRNDIPVDGAESATLVLPNFGVGDVGRYRLRLKTDDLEFFSEPIEVQINSEGQAGALARNKFFDATETPLRADWIPLTLASIRGGRAGPVLHAGSVGVVRGLNGTQIFDTTAAGRDADEPTHCGTQGGATYWFGYECTQDGTLRFDSEGTAFPAILAVYTFEAPLDRYDQLVPVTCAVANGGAAAVEFTGTTGRTYYVVLDGVGGARGTARLNYRLTPITTPPPVAPRITREPASQSLAPGQPLLLSVLAEGTEPMGFRWLRDEVEIPGATRPEYQVNQVTTADAGGYRVMVTNVAGSVTSTVATVQIAVPPPTLVRQPVSQTIPVGRALLLMAMAEGAGPLTFEWWKDDSPYFGVNDPELRIGAGSLSDSGDYRLVVRNPGGSVTSVVATVRVMNPPTTSATPARELVPRGGSLRLAPAILGSEPLEYRWRRGTEILPDAGPELALSDIASDQAGAYELEVSNEVGSVRAGPFEVVVVAPPEILAGPAAQRAGPGGRVAFALDAMTGEGGQVEWRKDGLPVAGAHGLQLEVGPCRAEDAGTYQAVVSNLAGVATSPPATLEIVAGPRLEIDRPSGNLDLWFPVAPDLGCRVEAAEDAGGGWQPFLEHPVIPSGLLRLRVNTGDGRLRFFRCLHSGTGGSTAGPTGP